MFTCLPDPPLKGPPLKEPPELLKQYCIKTYCKLLYSFNSMRLGIIPLVREFYSNFHIVKQFPSDFPAISSDIRYTEANRATIRPFSFKVNVYFGKGKYTFQEVDGMFKVYNSSKFQ